MMILECTLILLLFPCDLIQMCDDADGGEVVNVSTLRQLRHRTTSSR